MTFTAPSNPFLAAELAYHRERLLRDVSRARRTHRTHRSVAQVLSTRRRHVADAEGQATPTA